MRCGSDGQELPTTCTLSAIVLLLCGLEPSAGGLRVQSARVKTESNAAAFVCTSAQQRNSTILAALVSCFSDTTISFVGFFFFQFIG